MILFGQPLGGLYELPVSSSLSIGGISFGNRFGPFSLVEFFNSPYVSTSTTNNLWLYLLKSSVFGEFKYRINDVIPATILSCLIILVATASIGFIVGGYKAIRSRNQLWLFMGLTLLSVGVSYALFNVKYPFRCSMDFRYIAAASLLSALSISKVIDMIQHEKITGILIRSAFLFTISLFSVGSIIMFTTI